MSIVDLCNNVMYSFANLVVAFYVVNITLRIWSPFSCILRCFSVLRAVFSVLRAVSLYFKQFSVNGDVLVHDFVLPATEMHFTLLLDELPSTISL